MGKVGLYDFIPPIFVRGIKWLIRKVKPDYRVKLKDGIRAHPFDSVSSDLSVKWVLDIGANVGDVTFAALDAYPECNVICIEPVKDTFSRLKERLKPFSKRVHLYNIALSDHSGHEEINLTTSDGANSILPQSQFHKHLNPHIKELDKETIIIETLDDFSSSFPSQKIDIMKIDVEGYELNVLKGGEKFIENNVDTIIIEIALMRDESWENQSIFEIFNILNKMGFRLVNIIDLCHVADDTLLVQMDCVFRNKDNLTMPV